MTTAKAAEIVECDHCFLRAKLRQDDTYSAHGWTRHGVKSQCENSGKPYARHMGSFRVVKRNPNLWLAECRCGEAFTGDTYDEVEAPWLRHCAEMGASA